MSTINDRIQADRKSARLSKRAKRESGTGCLILPRPGISRFWRAQIRDINGKPVNRGRLRSGAKVSGELKRPDCDPKRLESWTNLTSARIMLKELVEDVTKGHISVGNDPSQLHYADLRGLLLANYAQQEMESLRKDADGKIYIDSLSHLDKFFGYENEGDKGSKVTQITLARLDAFIAERKASGAANGTINRSLAALRRMFKIAKKRELLQNMPFIEMLPEPKQPRQGFLEVADYEKLHAALPEYVQPILQTGYYTGMRLREILELTWSKVDLSQNALRLSAADTKTEQARIVPLIDGLPEMFEGLRRANPNAGENDMVFRGAKGQRIGSFIKAWRNTCIKCAIRTKLNGHEVVSHLSKGPDCCAYCKIVSTAEPGETAFPIKAGTYVGFLFHDLRRSALRNLIRAGVNQTVAKKISGHSTDAVFERYNITSEDDLQDAAVQVGQYLAQQKANPAATRRRLQAVS